jgi:hypothetical protein
MKLSNKEYNIETFKNVSIKEGVKKWMILIWNL